MKNAWKITGWYVFSLGIIHVLVGFFLFKEGLREIWNAGIFNGVGDSMAAHSAFWFQFLGFFFIYFGWHWKEQIKQHKQPLSKFTAWGMTVLTLAGFIFVPISGFILMMPLCFIMLYPHYFASGKS